MAVRAKLRYNGKSYMDEDLVYICKKELKFMGLHYLDYSIDRHGGCLVAVGYKTDRDKREGLSISFGELSCYNVGRSVNDLVVNGVVYDNDILLRVGNNVASLWGGSCLNYYVDKKNKIVTFDCVEHGEHFGTEVEFVELESYR